MKKTISILLVILAAISLLASCSAGGKNETSASSGYGTAAGGAPAPAERPQTDDFAYDYGYAASDSVANAVPPSSEPMTPEYEMLTGGEAGYATLPIAPIIPQGGDGLAEKIIYSVYADIETVAFDETVDQVYELLGKYGAFIEDSYVGGRNYTQEFYGYQSYRSARFTVRVPKDRLNDATEELNSLGNVTSLQSNAQNITAQFTDSESRLSTYRVEEKRLLEMLSKADTVADMITIETRLSEVRYNIESLTSTLKNWQNQIDYSTMTMYISEVEKLTDITPIQRSYWKQISEGFVSTLKSVGEFFKDVFKWIVVASPALVIVVVILAIIWLVVRRHRRRVRKEGAASDETGNE